ncbi:hypothetical protein CAPTEDRAFT_195437 [Capitella teleta]|uniref:CUB domain-containing protein n=1 Tax=Capitella teleta TaxID=283909 RepID=R7TL83_CAPTE|nr:hypothetical protein CAPTEDRAFT_195437 [Capitella teleta]|eukprot:ELT91855.1 hypothetical protein CAPTEDRAFT_195437 [Capitella teleta]
MENLLFTALLIIGIQVSKASVSVVSMKYRTPSEKVITSPNFPVPYVISDEGTPKVYAWSLVNLSPKGRVRLFFSDYDLNELSLIRVYQSSNVSRTASSTVWRHNDIRPIIRSTGNALLVVFKVGRQSVDNNNIGFRASVQYFQASNRKEEITTSSCGTLREYQERVSGVMSFSGVNSFSLPGNFKYSCVWSRRLRSDISYVALRVISPSEITDDWLHDGRLTVRSGPASYFKIANAPGHHDDIVVYRMWFNYGFYVSFDGPATGDDHVLMAYHETEEDALDMVRSLSPKKIYGSSCPYKQCGETCVPLWNACYNLFGDPSCEYSDATVQQCANHAHRCYLADVDVCDYYNDCGNYDDEVNCDQPHTHWLVGILKDTAILCGFLLLFWFFDILCTHPSRRRARSKILPCSSIGSNSSIDLSSCYYRNIIARIRSVINPQWNGNEEDQQGASTQGKKQKTYYYVFGIVALVVLASILGGRVVYFCYNNFCPNYDFRLGARHSQCSSSCQYCDPVQGQARSHSTMRQELNSLPPATVISLPPIIEAVPSPLSSQSSDAESLDEYGASRHRSSEAAASPPDYDQVTASDPHRSSERQPQGRMLAPPSYEEAVTQLPQREDVPPPAYDSLSLPQSETTV